MNIEELLNQFPDKEEGQNPGPPSDAPNTEQPGDEGDPNKGKFLWDYINFWGKAAAGDALRGTIPLILLLIFCFYSSVFRNMRLFSDKEDTLISDQLLGNLPEDYRGNIFKHTLPAPGSVTSVHKRCESRRTKGKQHTVAEGKKVQPDQPTRLIAQSENDTTGVSAEPGLVVDRLVPWEAENTALPYVPPASANAENTEVKNWEIREDCVNHVFLVQEITEDTAAAREEEIIYESLNAQQRNRPVQYYNHCAALLIRDKEKEKHRTSHIMKQARTAPLVTSPGFITHATEKNIIEEEKKSPVLLRYYVLQELVNKKQPPVHDREQTEDYKKQCAPLYFQQQVQQALKSNHLMSVKRQLPTYFIMSSLPFDNLPPRHLKE
jgi:hypothetical protein